MEPCDELSGKCQPPPPTCVGACDPNAALEVLKAVGKSFVGLAKSVALPFKAIGKWFESGPPVHGGAPTTFNAASDRATTMDGVREFVSEFAGGMVDWNAGFLPDQSWSTGRMVGASIASYINAVNQSRGIPRMTGTPALKLNAPVMSMGVRSGAPRMTAPSVPRTSTALPKGTRFVKAVGPGPNAGRSIPARGPQRDFTRAERDQLNEIGGDTGCHTCGTTNPGTKSGDFVADHQPPNSLNPTGADQRLFPQCLHCSRIQGGELRTLQRESP
jgi:hypothetical protein